MTTDGSNGRLRAKGFRQLLVWQKAMDLVAAVYEVTSTWPSDERFGLTSQARRAAVSIPSNLAEGQGRFGPGEFARYVSIAHGSLCELETQMLLSVTLGFSKESQVDSLIERINELGRMIRALYDSLSRSRSVKSSTIAEEEIDGYG